MLATVNIYYDDFPWASAKVISEKMWTTITSELPNSKKYVNTLLYSEFPFCTLNEHPRGSLHQVVATHSSVCFLAVPKRKLTVEKPDKENL
jgi:hypothetical protein